MFELSIPFPYNINKNELKAFYLSFLIRAYVIQGKKFVSSKITKQMFYRAMKEQGFIKSRITETWKYKEAGTFFNFVCDDYIILRGKENVQGEKGFITRLDYEVLGYYKFCEFVNDTYELRPVKQKSSFKDKYKFKKKSPQYNKEVFKRSLAEKIGRGQRKIAMQSWCCLKTVNNRTKRSTRVKTLKRYSEAHWMRVRKTNLYFNLYNKVYIYYNKNSSEKRRRISLNLDHSSLVSNALFINESKGLSNAYDTLYKLIPDLWITL